MLPQPPTPNPTEVTGEFTPVKRDFNNIDSLISELNEPKQEILSSDNVPGQSQLPGNGSEFYNDKSKIEITPEQAARSGERIAKTFNTAFAFSASLYAKAEERERYEATPGDVHDLSQAWADVAMKYSFKVEDSPWLNVLLLMSVVYAPIFIKAKNDRRDAILREEMAEMQKRQELKNAEILEKIQELEKGQQQAAA